MKRAVLGIALFVAALLATPTVNAQTVLLVVGDSSTLGTDDSERKALVESWGYTVTVIDDSDSQANFDTATAVANVAYISETTLSTNLGTKLRDTVIGVVNEEGFLYDEFGISSGAFFFNATATNIVDNSHYITTPFSTGSLTILSSTQTLVQLDGTLAGGIDTLASDFGWPSLSVVDTGGALYNGGTAAGRRVQLPWGSTPFNFSSLNSNGQTILRRALEWAEFDHSATGGGTGGLLLFVVGNSSTLGTDDSERKALVESWGYTVTVIDDSDSQANFDTATAVANVAYISETTLSTNLGTKLRDTVIGVVNEEGFLYDEFGISSGAFFFNATSTNIVDNSHYITTPFSTGSLTILSSTQTLVQLDGTLAGGIDTLASDFGWPSLSAVDTGGALYTGGTAAGRRVQLPWGSTPFNFSALNSNGQTILRRALEWAEFERSGGDHFVIDHDGSAIHCLAEIITVRIEDINDSAVTTFSETVTLDTQSGRGTWSLAKGGGTLNDGAADDGIATYTWVTGESEAGFSLFYPEGAASIDVDVYQSNSTSVRDTDTEGALDFSPSGFSLTATALSNPPPATITTFADPQTAGVNFAVHVAAYGQTPTDAQCGVIENYTGAKTLDVWSNLVNPTTGTVVPTVNGTPVGASEPGAAAIAVTFANGQASFIAKYKDAGSIRVAIKDDSSSHPDLPTGIRGSTADFVVKPYEFVLSAIVDSSSAANPGAADAGGNVFVAAGETFAITVEARDAEGSVTANFGRENTAESVALTSSLVAPVGGQNPAVVGTFGTFVAGAATGTTFSWSEVGIITLTPSVDDGNYLGAGDVVGAASGNIGRFVPDHFSTTVNSPTFATGCAAGSFTYIGQGFDYSNAPVMTITARAVDTSITENYAGDFFKIDIASLPDPVYTSVPATLDTSGLPGGASDPAVSALGNGVGTLTFSSGTGLLFTRGAEEAAFAADIQLSLNVVDSDGVTPASNPVVFGNPGGILFDGGTDMRYGRARLINNIGSELVNLAVPFTTEYFVDASVGFVTHTDDSCTGGVNLALGPFTGSLSNGETCTLDSGFPGSSGSGCTAPSPPALQFSEPPTAGDFNLVLQAPGDTNDGSVVVTGSVPIWLQYDWNSATPGFENPSATAVFGIYSGERRQIYTREIFR